MNKYHKQHITRTTFDSVRKPLRVALVVSLFLCITNAVLAEDPLPTDAPLPGDVQISPSANSHRPKLAKIQNHRATVSGNTGAAKPTVLKRSTLGKKGKHHVIKQRKAKRRINKAAAQRQAKPGIHTKYRQIKPSTRKPAKHRQVKTNTLRRKHTPVSRLPKKPVRHANTLSSRHAHKALSTRASTAKHAKTVTRAKKQSKPAIRPKKKFVRKHQKNRTSRLS